MHALHIFTFAIAAFLFVDALPYEKPNAYTIPLKMKPTFRRRANNVTRRALEIMPINQEPPDSSYYGEITFGTGNEQKFNIMFDTGSSDLFVIAEECVDSPGCQNKPKYELLIDQSYVDLKETFHIEFFDDAAVDGELAKTTIKIGGLTVEGQGFGLAAKVTDDFIRTPYTGMMGLGFSSGTEGNLLTPITNLINKGAIDKPQFSFMLGRDADHSPSELTIGGSNPERFDANSLTWTDLSDQNNWAIPVEGLVISDQPLDFQGRTALIDTGSTRIIIPNSDAEAFYAKIPNSEGRSDGTYLIPCDTNIVIGMKFSGKTWNMDVRDFVIRSGLEGCVGSIESGDTGSDTIWHVGVAFLKNVYSIFDQGDFRIGFGLLKKP